MDLNASLHSFTINLTASVMSYSKNKPDLSITVGGGLPPSPHFRLPCIQGYLQLRGFGQFPPSTTLKTGPSSFASAAERGEWNMPVREPAVDSS